MTTSTEPPALAPDGRSSSPAHAFRRIGGALSLLGAGTLTCASLLMIPYQNETSAQYLQTGVDHRSNILWAAVVLHFGYLLLLPAALTLVRLARREQPEDLAGRDAARRARRRACPGSSSWTSTTWPWPTPCRPTRRSTSGTWPRATGRASIVAATSVLGMVVGINLAVFAAWRARAIPVYPLVLSVVGWVVFTLFSGDAVAAVGRHRPRGDRPRVGRA